MKYATGRDKTAVTMYIIQDARELAAHGQQAGTLLVKHQFAESYANRGHYMYSDLENFLGLTLLKRGLYEFISNYIIVIIQAKFLIFILKYSPLTNGGVFKLS